MAQYAGPIFQHTVDALPTKAAGPVYQNTVEGQFMGIRAKQMLSSTFDLTEVGRLFTSTSIAGAKLANGAVDTTQLAPNAVDENKIAASAISNGLTGGGGSVLAVDPDSETGGNTQPVSVASNGVGVDINAIAGTGIEADGSANLRVAAQGTGIAGGGGTTLSFDAAAADGNGLTGSGAVLTVDSDTETGGNIQGANVTANGVGVDISAIAGTGIEADGSANLRLATQGTGIAGGNGTTLSVDTGSTVNFAADTPVWTFGNETTAEGLFVSGTPQDANHVPNKTYVDNAVAGLLWKDPAVTVRLLGNVDVNGLVGNLAALAIEALSPTAGDAYVVTTANGAGALSAAVLGDIWQYVVTTWTKIVSGAGGFVPDGTYCLLSTTETLIAPYTPVTHDGYRARFNGSDNDPTDQGSADFFSPNSGDAYVIDGSGEAEEGCLCEWSGTAYVSLETPAGGFVAAGVRAMLGAVPGTAVLIAPYTDATDDSKIVDFSGSSNTGVDTGDAVNTASLLIQDTGHVGVNDNNAYVFEGTVPTGSWIQWNGGGSLNAGAGLTLDGNTLNVGDAAKGVQVNADNIQVDASEIAGDGLEQLAGGGNEHTLKAKSDVTTGGNIQAANVAANGVGVDINAIAGTGIEADGSANLRLATQGTGIAGGGGSTLSFDATDADGNGLSGTGAVLTVDPDSETGGNTQPVSVAANGVGVDISAIAGTGIEADGSANLRLATQGTGIGGGNGSTLSFDATAADGNGLSGTGAVLTVDVDSETAGNIQPVNVTANGVGVDISAIAGTGLEADGSANLQVDTGSTVDFSADTPVWTFGNETTAEGLFVSGTPQDANHVVNKAYVDTLSGTFIQESIATEAITGSDTEMAAGLTQTALATLNVRLYLNGVFQVQGASADYTVVTGTGKITWLAAQTAVDMDTSDVLIAVYEY